MTERDERAGEVGQSAEKARVWHWGDVAESERHDGTPGECAIPTCTAPPPTCPCLPGAPEHEHGIGGYAADAPTGPSWVHGDDSTVCPNIDDTWTCVEHCRPVFARPADPRTSPTCPRCGEPAERSDDVCDVCDVCEKALGWNQPEPVTSPGLPATDPGVGAAGGGAT